MHVPQDRKFHVFCDVHILWYRAVVVVVNRRQLHVLKERNIEGFINIEGSFTWE